MDKTVVVVCFVSVCVFYHQFFIEFVGHFPTHLFFSLFGMYFLI